MNESRWLQRVALSLPSQIAGSELTEFLIDERRELIESLLIAPCPLGQKVRYFVG
jgi:hypothetical protein